MISGQKIRPRGLRAMLIAGGLIAANGAAPAFAEDSAAAGKRIYMAVGCFECHGRAGEGGNFKGLTPVLAHTALPLDAFAMQLRQPQANMPAYAATVLPDKDVGDIYAYVQSLPGLRDIKAIPEILTH